MTETRAQRPSAPGPPPAPARANTGRNAAFATLSAGSGVLLLALLIFAGRWLGDDAYGRFSFALALAVIFETLTDFGLKDVTTRAVARDRRLAASYLANTFGLKLLLGAATVFLLAATVALLRPEWDVRVATVALGCAAVFRSYMTSVRSVFYGIDRFDLETAVLVADRGLLLVIGMAALLAGYGVMGLAIAFVVARAAALAAAWILATGQLGRVGFGADLGFWRDLQLQAVPFGAFLIVLQLYNYIDTVMLGLMRGDAETGLYNAAYRLYEGASHIPSIIGVVLTPRLAREYVSDRLAHARLAKRGLVAAAALALPASAAGILVAGPVTRALFGLEYDASVRVFQILIAGAAVVFPLAVLHAVAISMNAERRLLATAVVGCAANLALNLLLIPPYGMHGAAAATLLGEAISLGVLGALLWRPR
ncbi:MAG TPA: flippase [Vicinamibacterales bacterium]|nr:flippase [Vicinamibacterales bacterium]